VARSTRLVTGSGGVNPEGGVRFSGEVIVAVGAFAPSQVFNFGSLAYIADCSCELPLQEILGSMTICYHHKFWYFCHSSCTYDDCMTKNHPS
jgi:hypothetical protein